MWYDVRYNVEQNHSSCVELGETGQQFTLNSESLVMNVLANISAAEGAESFDFDGSVTGWVDWSAEERTGGCEVSINYEASLTETTITASSWGNICGVEFSQEFTYGDVT